MKQGKLGCFGRVLDDGDYLGNAILGSGIGMGWVDLLGGGFGVG